MKVSKYGKKVKGKDKFDKKAYWANKRGPKVKGGR